MLFRGLKLSITLQFATLLLIGMLLINFILLSIWFQYVVKDAVSHVGEQLSLLEKYDKNICKYGTDGVKIPSEIFWGKSRELLLFKGGEIVKGNPATLKKYKEALKNSSLLSRRVVEKYGDPWSFLGMGIQDILVTQPIGYCEDTTVFGVVIHISEIRDEIYSKQTIIFVYLLFNVIVLTTLSFFRMRKLVIKPLENLINLAESFKEEGIGLLSMKKADTEFGSVALVLHKMLSKIDKDTMQLQETIVSLENANRTILENQATVIEAEKISAIGRLSAGLAHEIGNPLGIIQGYLELLKQQGLTKEDQDQYTKRALKELARVDALIRQLLDFSRKNGSEQGDSLLVSAITEQIEIFKHQKFADGIDIQTKFPANDIRVRISEGSLNQVILNCLLNAIDSIKEGKKSHEGVISIEVKEKALEQKVSIQLSDNGAGIDESLMDSIFEPFYTTKEVGCGTGLGLSVCRSIVEQVGGTIALHNNDGHGVTVDIELPTLDLSS